MARSRRSRRYYKRKGRYSANIQEINDQILTAKPGSWSGTNTLATNPVQNSLGVSQTYTVKNMEISFTIEGDKSSNSVFIEGVTTYIMYVPQGMTVSENYNLEHPEYVLTYKYLGSPVIEDVSANNTAFTQNYQPFKVKTRMARRLQTGDSIVLFVKGFNKHPTDTVFMKVSGLVRWWTKAN